MNTEIIKNNLLRAIEPLWKKESNTLYALRVVPAQFDNPMKLFFEWNKVGRATHSQEIASYSRELSDQVIEATKRLKSEVGLTVFITE